MAGLMAGSARVARLTQSGRPGADGGNMDARDDNALLEAIVLRRDGAAFKELFERHQAHAFNLAYKFLNNSQQAEDIVQETMLSIWLSKKSSLPDGNVRGWVLAIVAGKSLTLKRSQRRRTQREENAAMERSGTDTPVSVGVDLERKELIAILRRHIEGLSEVERDLLTCCYGANMPHRKVGALLGLSQASVSEKLQQICQRLRSNLTRIGVAAVIPLLSAEGIHEAMTTGHPCPPGMVEGLAQRIEMSGSRAMRKLARRSWYSSAGAALTLIVVLGGGACGAWMWTQRSAPTVQSAPVAAAQMEDAPIHAKWTFEKGPAADLVPMQKQWTWRATAHGGEMVSPTDPGLLIPLPLSLPRHPIVIKVSAMQDVSGEFAMTALWMNNRLTVPTRQWLDYKKFRTDPPFHMETRLYFIDRYLVCEWNGNLSSVIEAPTPYPSRKIALSFRKLNVEEIDVHSLTPAEIPDELKDIPKLIQQMGKPKNFDEHGEPVVASPH